MIAYVVRKYGNEQKLSSLEVPEPQPGAKEVLIGIRAASINPVDFKIRNGDLRLLTHYALPLTLGNDCSGIVEAVGHEVTRFKVGDAVFTRPGVEKIGTFANKICAYEDVVALKPENTSFAEAASLPLVGLTAWQAFHEQWKLQAGQKVFILAGAGGVGTFAIQLAKTLGATVATTASPKKHELLKSLGADVLINYRSEDYREKVRDYDLVLDTLGGEEQKRSLACLKPGGMIVSIVGPPTRLAAKEWNAPLWIKVAAGLMGWPAENRARKCGAEYRFMLMRPDGAQLSQIAKLVEAGKIRPVIDRVYPMDHVEEALRYVETGRATGKVVLRA